MSTLSFATTATSNWLEKLARLGNASRGAIYILVGIMALVAAVGLSGSTDGTKGALQTVLGQHGGWIVVAIISLGLIGHAVRRFCQAFLDADNHGTDAKGLVIRTGLFVSAITHFSLAFWAGKAAFGYASQNDSGSKETLIAWLMSKPFGQW